MRKIIPKLRKHINTNKLETSTICGVLILVSLIQIIFLFRDSLVAPVLAKTGSDTLVKIIYFDKLRDPNLMYSLGEYYFGSGTYDLEKAKSYFEKSINLDEKLPLAHYQLSRVYFITGDQAKALTEINKEIKYNPDFMRSYYIRGLVHGYSGQLQYAVDDFKTFLAWKPTSWAGHNDLAWVYFQQGDFENAYITAMTGIKHSPDNPWLLNTVGISLKNLGQPELAKGAFEKALTKINTLSPEEWGKAYPGNDPAFYDKGFSNMKKTVENNLSLLQTNPN